MTDTFSILLSHVLVLIACWRLLSRDDLDHEAPAAPSAQDAGSSDA
ncbi:MAG: hypothetical protein R3E11_04515 [Sphingobium sp.]|nr:hypothetical protein [Sphingobium sp.]MCP5398757.1 hypothetical protein [Sphingomonas sp.]